jgi:hypothetical protein
VKVAQPRLNKFLHPTPQKEQFLSEITLFNYPKGNKIEYRQPARPELLP